MIRRLIDISYKYKLGHLGSCLTALPIIQHIYEKMDKDDIFILSSGHAALALYVCLEKYRGQNAEELFLKHGSHPHWDEEAGIHCSTGSLGMGITIALGRAIANKNRKVYVLISDGECAEGSVWEALKTIYEEKIENIEVHVNINGYSAYKKVDKSYLINRLTEFLTITKQLFLWETGEKNDELSETEYDIGEYLTEYNFSFLKGLNAHYHVMTEEDYKQAISEI